MGEPMPRTKAQMIFHWRRLGLIVVLTTVVVGVGGCHHAGRAQQQVLMRGERPGAIVAKITKSEQRRGRQLERTVDLLHAALLRDVETSRANVAELKRYWQRDWKPPTERLPMYRKQTRELLGGELPSVGPNPITLFF
jgi:hypothetical protein